MGSSLRSDGLRSPCISSKSTDNEVWKAAPLAAPAGGTVRGRGTAGREPVMSRPYCLAVLALGVGLLAGAAVIVWRAVPSRPGASLPPRNESRVVWLFEPPQRGAIIASPCLAGDRVYVSAIADGFVPRGAVYCLGAADGRVRWKFDDNR